MANKVICGDSLTELRKLPDNSVHMAVTSPPYFGQRDYGTAKWVGGDPKCRHICADRWPQSLNDRGDAYITQVRPGCDASKCRRCGARRRDKQIGLEQKPEAYVANLVTVMRELRRVLRDDGTLWLNLGDSYAAERGGTEMPAETLAGGVGGHARNGRGNRGRRGNNGANGVGGEAGEKAEAGVAHRRAAAIGLKHKDLIGIPWRVAFALQADGWWLRSDVVWQRPNSMPESVTDRCTNSHEYIFMLAKRPYYFFDYWAIRERSGVVSVASRKKTFGGKFSKVGNHGIGAPLVVTDGHNKPSVWNIPTEPFSGAHFATFPRKLIVPCVKAGTSEKGCCSKCGAPWARVVKRGRELSVTTTKIDAVKWKPGCSCNAGDPVPCVVLDPFAGSGTVGVVAQHLGRNSILIELNPEFCAMIKRRLVGGWNYKMPKDRSVQGPQQERFF